MTTLSAALGYYRREVHEALWKSARGALSLPFGTRSYALNTVAGSLLHCLPTPTPSAKSSPFSSSSPPLLWWTPSEAQEEQIVSLCAPHTSSPPCSTASAAVAAVSDAPALAFSMEDVVPINLPLWSSKYGGFGFLPKTMAYPVHTKTGVPLQLIAQVNLSELWESVDRTLQRSAVDQSDSLQQKDGEPQEKCVGASSCTCSVCVEAIRQRWFPDLPEKGIVAFYTCPFDELYGCTFEPRAAQDGYRVLFFEDDYDALVAPLLQRYQRGELGLAELETALSNVLWTREEQYDLFEKAYREDLPGVRERAHPHWIVSNQNKDGDSPVDMEAERQAQWRLPLLTESASRVKAPSLWYGAPLSMEYPMRLELPSPEIPAEATTTAMTSSEGVACASSSAAPCKTWKTAAPEANKAQAEEEEDDEGSQCAACVKANKPSSAVVVLMVPTHSVEWVQQVLTRVARRHPELDPRTTQTGQSALLACYNHRALASSTSSKQKANEDQEDDDDDDEDEGPTGDGVPCNYLSGYPHFTQSDPRDRLYTNKDGGWAEEPASSPPDADDDGAVATATATTTSGKAKEWDATGRVPVLRDDDGCIVADCLLFQIGQADERFMWGDCGEGNWFIALDDLRAKRFDKVWFNWDCC